jgi:putative two-component system response regulator
MAGNKRKIATVDDNPENLGVLKNTMKDIYMVFPLPSAQGLFDLLEHVTPDLILLDVEMPEMDGYEAAEKLKSSDKYRNIPIIFLTSREDAGSKEKGLSLGAVDYIHKPIVAQALLERLETFFS